MILLSCNYPNKIRFDLYLGTKTIPLSEILDLSISTICTIFTSLDQIIYPPVVVKSQVLG